MRLFLDANLILDYLNERQGFVESARKIMILGSLKECSLWMSSSQMTEVFYVLTNGGRASEANEAKRSLRYARQFIQVCSLTETDIDAALESTWIDFEDACVYQCAQRLKADAIITRNQKDFEKSSIKVFDPEQLFEYLEKEKGLVYDFIPF